MNPYAFRGWHLPSAYADSGSCDRNYPTCTRRRGLPPTFLRPPSTLSRPTLQHPPWPSRRPTPTSGSCRASAPRLQREAPVNVRENGLVGKGGYEGLLYKPNAGPGAMSARSAADFEGAAAAAARDEVQKSCCAISCTCSTGGHQGSRLNGMLDTSCTWRTADMSPALDFKQTANISPYQTLCQRGESTLSCLDINPSPTLPSSPQPSPSPAIKMKKYRFDS
ncbi:hypothetical protein C0Q70_02610 [Pomacea canaliculata]|uniref:Uncharacterized protein n=1 Tax=Pomacea canaliculata TaxID=400727 RepID=A0A2T7PQJ3_POMCA|nr:hypothetical protein C0Q70_02610 [Pomacea canaliculata]